MRGLTAQEFSRSSLKAVPYRPVYGDLGFTRCNLCLVDFFNGEKVKQFPGCDHLFHVKCLELWSILDPSCPNCSLCYNPSAPQGQGALLVLTRMAENVSIESCRQPLKVEHPRAQVSASHLREPLLPHSRT